MPLTHYYSFNTLIKRFTCHWLTIAHLLHQYTDLHVSNSLLLIYYVNAPFHLQWLTLIMDKYIFLKSITSLSISLYNKLLWMCLIIRFQADLIICNSYVHFSQVHKYSLAIITRVKFWHHTMGDWEVIWPQEEWWCSSHRTVWLWTCPILRHLATAMGMRWTIITTLCTLIFMCVCPIIRPTHMSTVCVRANSWLSLTLSITLFTTTMRSSHFQIYY